MDKIVGNSLRTTNLFGEIRMPENVFERGAA